jgi:hypothetical protein
MTDSSQPGLNTIPLLSDKKGGNPGMPLKSGFLLIDNDSQLIRDHAHNLREALFACTTKPQVECAVAFARCLNFAGLNNDNYWLFLRLIMTNNTWVIDELLHDRIARLLFSTIRPSSELIDAAFEMLYSKHPEEIYTPAMESVLGIIQNAYFDADDGYRIRKLSMMDINALGKFLIKNEPQEHSLNRLILEILDRIARIGDYYGEQDKSVLSKHAFNVRYAYFDHARNLIDAIPEPLLIPLPENKGVHPDEDYEYLVSKRREQNIDNPGRFIKEKDTVNNLKTIDKVSAEENTEKTDEKKTRNEQSINTQKDRFAEKKEAKITNSIKKIKKKSGSGKSLSIDPAKSVRKK